MKLFPFCANPFCAFHVDVAPDIRYVSFIKHDGTRAKVGRQLVAQEGKPDLTLCDVCANVLVITK